MEQLIWYYYDIKVNKLYKDNNAYFFNLSNKIFYFVLYEREEDIKTIIELKSLLEKNHISCHNIIKNKFGNIISCHNEKKYILLALDKDLKREIDCIDIYNNNRKINLEKEIIAKYIKKWEDMWINKIEYYERQVHEYAKDNSIILDTFSYYAGLSEMGISILGNIKNRNKIDLTNKITFCHRRIFFPNYKLNFFNPLSIIIDVDVRDYAEYFKAAFFSGENIKEEFVALLKIYKMSDNAYLMFFARLLFPTYYFDCYEEMIQNNVQTEKIIKIINKRKTYEQFLNFAYNEINKYSTLPKIDWINCIIDQH